jgi:hypothetical protein
MTEPANIWIDFMAANRAYAAYDEPPETDTQDSRTPYRRATLPRPDDAARIAALEEANARLRAGLEEIIADANSQQSFYDRNGPTWTGKDGHEYADMSDYLSKCAEYADTARAALEAPE